VAERVPSLALPSLADEARHLHACVFAAPPDPVVVARYEAAHALAQCRSFFALVAPAILSPVLLREANFEENPTKTPAARPPALPGCPVVAKVVARKLDAEAVEFALRRRGKGRELARKMQILCYLVEVRPEYLERFVNSETSRRRAWAAVGGATLLSAWTLLKGEYLIRRHGLL